MKWFWVVDKSDLHLRLTRKTVERYGADNSNIIDFYYYHLWFFAHIFSISPEGITRCYLSDNDVRMMSLDNSDDDNTTKHIVSINGIDEL